MNSTTWILDLKERISEPMNKVRNAFSGAMNAAKKATQGAVATISNSLNKSTQSVKSEVGRIGKLFGGLFAVLKERISEPMNKVRNAFSGAMNAAKKAIQGAVATISNSLNKSTQSLQSEVGRIGKLFGGLFAVSQLKSFGSSIIDITGSFQRYQAVLTNTFLSEEEARKSMKMLQNLASEMPVSLDEVTGSYVKLVNRGFKATKEEMLTLSDVASYTGKSFDQLTEALLDAETGEFERLKEFGIKGSQLGDKVSLDFGEKGGIVTIKKTREEIRKAILEFGKMPGVAGASAAIMETLPGKINNMEDAWDAFKVKIGMGESPFLISIIDKITAIIELATEHSDTIVSLFKSIAVGAGIAGIALTALKVKAMLASVSSLTLSTVLKGLWATMLANPFIAITAGAAAVIFAITKLWQKSEGFRKFIYGLWGAIKEVFKSLWDIVKNFFGGLGDMIEGLVTFKFSKITEGAERAGDALLQATNPAWYAYKNKDKIKNAYTENSKKGIKEKEKEAESLPVELAKDKKTTGLTLPTSDKDKSSSGSGSGGGQIRNVTTTIKQLVGTVNIYAATVKGGASEVKSQLTEALVSAVRDSEIAMS